MDFPFLNTYAYLFAAQQQMLVAMFGMFPPVLPIHVRAGF